MRNLTQKEQVKMTVVAALLVLSTIGMIGLKTYLEEDDEKSEGENDNPSEDDSLIEMPNKKDVDYKYNTFHQAALSSKDDKLIDELHENRRKKRDEEIQLAKQYAKVTEERRLAKEAEEDEKERLAEVAKQEQLKKEEQKRAERLAQKKIEREEEKKKEQQVVSRSSNYQSNYEMTHYTAFCDTGCAGITAAGVDVSSTIHYQGLRIVAAPPNIPLYTKLRITYADGTRIDAIALDRGGAIKGKLLDLLVSSKEEAYRLGRQQVKVEIIK